MTRPTPAGARIESLQGRLAWARAGNASRKRHIRARRPHDRRSRILRRPPLAPHARRRGRITAYEAFCAGEPAVKCPACDERPHHDGQENAADDDDGNGNGNGRACEFRRLARADGQRGHMARGALRLGDGFHPLLRDAPYGVEQSLPREVALGSVRCRRQPVRSTRPQEISSSVGDVQRHIRRPRL